MGLFGPDWKSGNMDKALAAVDNAAPDELSEIARKARRQEVAYRAVERLAKLSREEDLVDIATRADSDQVKAKAAQSIVNAEVLASLMQDERDMYAIVPSGMYFGIASNPNTPPDLLDKLLLSHDAKLRYEVVKNPSLSDETIIRLSGSSDVEMCRRILDRKDLPKKALKTLELHPNREINYRAKWHDSEATEEGKAKIRFSMKLQGIIK